MTTLALLLLLVYGPCLFLLGIGYGRAQRTARLARTPVVVQAERERLAQAIRTSAERRVFRR